MGKSEASRPISFLAESFQMRKCPSRSAAISPSPMLSKTNLNIRVCASRASRETDSS